MIEYLTRVYGALGSILTTSKREGGRERKREGGRNEEEEKGEN